jgi:glycosyltransferase involved in cell wall biosynthesis
MSQKIVIYRTSDKGNPKLKLFNNNRHEYLKTTLHEFLNWHFIFILDNVTEDTEKEFQINYSKFGKIISTSLGNSGSYYYAINFAINNYEKNDIIYFLEDDYYHLKGASDAILSALDLAQYVTLYDHPDKYVRRGKFLLNFVNSKSQIFLTRQRHFRTTDSTTMTFATHVSTLKKDLPFHKLFTVGYFSTSDRKLLQLIPSFLKYKKIPLDFELWLALRILKKKNPCFSCTVTLYTWRH